MKRDWIRTMVSKLAATLAVLLFLLLVPAVAAGSLPLWGALLLGALGVVVLNGACGVLLALQAGEEAPRQEQPVPSAVPLRVVRGGRAA
ncbi:hypothetical protein [uncultured Subdoligranulum sp.]|uniref:Uncharacterized protein n=1 Tax=Candidatus Gemmiger excrementavium TaxID=2838608 RepID=A0A9D2F313_9FIRM|nr:hypothetical protein [uncultured Subdoligranulum sp.]HIZ48267.1 hypothetical protein [Candidatus Gemmiger excrementavium]